MKGRHLTGFWIDDLEWVDANRSSLTVNRARGSRLPKLVRAILMSHPVTRSSLEDYHRHISLCISARQQLEAPEQSPEQEPQSDTLRGVESRILTATEVRLRQDEFYRGAFPPLRKR